MMALMQAAHPELSIRRLCALVGVSRTWYYTRPSPDDMAARDTALRDAIERLVLAFPGYGLPPGDQSAPARRLGGQPHAGAARDAAGGAALPAPPPLRRHH